LIANLSLREPHPYCAFQKLAPKWSDTDTGRGVNFPAQKKLKIEGLTSSFIKSDPISFACQKKVFGLNNRVYLRI